MNNPEERTFTQTELDQIIKDRLTKERSKYQAEANQRTAELDRRERLLSAKEEWREKGLPVALLDSIDLSKEGAIEAAELALGNIAGKTTENKHLPHFSAPLGNSSEGRFDRMRVAFGLDHRKDE